jgi:transmembrane sensor
MEENEHIEGLILKYLNKEASPAEESELQQWLDADPEHRQDYQALEKIWRVSGPVLHRYVFDKGAAWEKMESRLVYSPDINARAGAKRLVIPKRWAVAAAVLLILVSAGWWYSVKSRTSPSRIIFAQNANQQVSLPDGSIVYLRKGAMIKYTEPFNGKERQVEMSGEAFFQPAHNPGTPFRISTAHAIIEDIGTSFLVKDQEGADEVIVAAGKIKFMDKARSSNNIVLLAGQKAILKENKFIQFATTDSNFMAWRTGVLYFHDTPLDQAVQDIGDFYQLAVSIAPDLRSEAGKIKVTARFEHQSLEELLEEMRLTTGLQINHEKNTLFFRRQ